MEDKNAQVTAPTSLLTQLLASFLSSLPSSPSQSAAPSPLPSYHHIAINIKTIDDEHQHHHHLHHRPHFTRDLGPFSTLTEPRSVHIAFTSLDKHPLAFLTRPSDSTVNIARYATCTTQTTGFDKTLYVQYIVMFTDPAHFCIDGRHYRNKVTTR